MKMTQRIYINCESKFENRDQIAILARLRFLYKFLLYRNWKMLLSL